MTKTSKTADIKELTVAFGIYNPWNAVTTVREAWKVVLTSGTIVTLCINLGAAVELEEAGFNISAC
jgi:hypothetical protein